MNGWDIFTWLCSVALAASALVIFGYFLRDARSILDREMHQQDDGPESSATSESAAGGARPDPPEDLSP
jgi:hypothetical protein